MISPSRSDDADIERLLTAIRQESSRQARTRNIILIVMCTLILTSVTYYIDTLQQTLPPNEILSIGLEYDAPTSSLKKDGAATTTDATHTDVAGTAAAIGYELDSVVRLFGAAGAFRQIVSASAHWDEYVDQREDDPEFLLAMTTLRVLGLVDFEPDDIKNAQVTERGHELASSIALTQERGRDDPTDTAQTGESGVPTDVNMRSLRVNSAEVNDVSFSDEAEDWYSFRVAVAGLYLVRTAQAESESDMVDTVVSLFDQDGEEIGNDDDGGEGLYSLLREHLEPEQQYYLRVTSYDGRGGRYSVSVADALTDARYKRERLQRVLDGATELRANGEVSTGNVGPVDAWYKLTIDNAGAYDIQTGPSGTMEPHVDTVIRLYDETGEAVIGEDDDGAGVHSYSLLHENLSAGVYYVRVSSFWRNDGTFQIAVSPQD